MRPQDLPTTIRKYNKDIRLIFPINPNIVIIHTLKVGDYSWKSKTISLNELEKEPKYIQKLIKERLC